MNKIYLLIAVLSLASCQKKQEQKSEVKITEVPTKSLSESDLAKKWLVEKIEENFETPDGLMDSICTKKYAEYKSDAMGVDYDGGLTIKAFEKKWKEKFDLKHA